MQTNRNELFLFIKMSKDFINPPCKRFRRTTYDNMGFNTVRAHHSLTKDGCSRLESLVWES